MRIGHALIIALITIACLSTGCSSKSSNSNNSNNSNRATSTAPLNANVTSEVESSANAAVQNPSGRASDTQTGAHSAKNSNSKNANKTVTLDTSRPHQSANNAVREGRRLANEGERQIRNILGRP